MAVVKTYLVKFNDDGSIDSVTLRDTPVPRECCIEVFATSTAKAIDQAKGLYSVAKREQG